MPESWSEHVREEDRDWEGEEPDGPEEGQIQHRLSQIRLLLAARIRHVGARHEHAPEHQTKEENAPAGPVLVVVELAELVVVLSAEHLQRQVQGREPSHKEASKGHFPEDALGGRPQLLGERPRHLVHLGVLQRLGEHPEPHLHQGGVLAPSTTAHRSDAAATVRGDGGSGGGGHRLDKVVQVGRGPPTGQEDQQQRHQVLAGPLGNLSHEIQREESVPPP
mmetsp:Transcript_19386/g.40812  ORF Transcript_19386/g.40812 Transcript_19386/m.40812 type:complete len:221 (-) Transcript_19386:812-1474(-)